jgi:hypothetical protein
MIGEKGEGRREGEKREKERERERERDARASNRREMSGGEGKSGCAATTNTHLSIVLVVAFKLRRVANHHSPKRRGCHDLVLSTPHPLQQLCKLLHDFSLLRCSGNRQR